MGIGWYVLQALTGYESRVEKTIQNLIDSGAFEGILNAVKVPVESVVEMRNGKKRNMTKKFFPGYVLVEMDLSDSNWRPICSKLRGMNNVIGFVGFSKQVKPQPISQDEARTILQRSGDIKTDVKFQVKNDFSVGESVRIIEGPFDTFTGRIDEVLADRNKLRVMVGIFGRVTSVELDCEQVEKLS